MPKRTIRRRKGDKQIKPGERMNCTECAKEFAVERLLDSMCGRCRKNKLKNDIEITKRDIGKFIREMNQNITYPVVFKGKMKIMSFDTDDENDEEKEEKYRNLDLTIFIPKSAFDYIQFKTPEEINEGDTEQCTWINVQILKSLRKYDTEDELHTFEILSFCLDLKYTTGLLREYVKRNNLDSPVEKAFNTVINGKRYGEDNLWKLIAEF